MMRDEEKSHSKFENFCQTIKNFVKTEEINLIFDPNSKKARHYSDDEKKSGKKEIPSYLKRKLENNKYPENEKIIYEKPGRKKLRRAWCFNDRGAILPYVASVYYTHYICISQRVEGDIPQLNSPFFAIEDLLYVKKLKDNLPRLTGPFFAPIDFGNVYLYEFHKAIRLTPLALGSWEELCDKLNEYKPRTG